MKTRIGDISMQIRGVSYKPSDISDGQASHSIAVLRANNISNDGNIETSDLVWIRGERVKSEQFLRDGDILLCASSGSKGLVGKAAQINGDCGMSFGAFCKVIRPTIANKKYLGFYFQSPKYRHSISESSAGININNIRTEDLDHLEIDLPDEIEQGRRCFILDKAVKAIRLRRQQIEKLNDLVKSQFIEMFGEVGSDKNGWGIHPFSEFCEINPKKGNDARIRKGMDVSFVPMQSVSEQGDIDVTTVKTYEEVQKGFTYFSEDDVLFAKITPCMENGKGAIARGLKNSVGFGSTEFHVIRPKMGVSNSEWIYAITSFPRFRQDAARKMTGSAGQRRVPASFLASYMVSCPPFELQEQYARFIEQTDKSKILFDMGVAA